jgi:hypothetical protein
VQIVNSFSVTFFADRFRLEQRLNTIVTIRRILFYALLAAHGMITIAGMMIRVRELQSL